MLLFLLGTKNKTHIHLTPMTSRHLYFFNVTQHGFPAFAWMNFVRNPVSRFISDFYYVRGRHRWIHNRVLKNQPRPSELWFNMSLDTCVAEANTECLPALGQDHELQLTYFCGQHPHCRIVGDRGALARAKRHAEHYYSVVGILEEMPLSLQVLQAYMPRFFTGATQMNNSTGEIRRNVKHDKPEVSETTKRALESRLKEDMEFYQFLKQRLHLQAEALSEK
ncbi:unnamed protein product [Meganyctiphanes norvegica]|uniref:Uncharacterized protein n=1 Tax=Meganyctiphanes norvegica TaxID=48144 RepID=A0AAV2QNW4_MEGNR